MALFCLTSSSNIKYNTLQTAGFPIAFNTNNKTITIASPNNSGGETAYEFNCGCVIPTQINLTFSGKQYYLIGYNNGDTAYVPKYDNTMYMGRGEGKNSDGTYTYWPYLYSGGYITAKSALTTGGFMWAYNSISTNANISAVGTIHAGGNISTAANMTATNMIATNKVTAQSVELSGSYITNNRYTYSYSTKSDYNQINLVYTISDNNINRSNTKTININSENPLINVKNNNSATINDVSITPDNIKVELVDKVHMDRFSSNTIINSSGITISRNNIQLTTITTDDIIISGKRAITTTSYSPANRFTYTIEVVNSLPPSPVSDTLYLII